MLIVHVVGARPNFMKVTPVMRAIAAQRGCEQVLVHTGQHYSPNLSDVFFRELNLPRPDVNLGVGSGSHAAQTATIMLRFEEYVVRMKPARVVVYGDVNSTLAAVLVCAKLGIPVDHVEAGLRSGDRSMPEEINRLVTDQLAEQLFTPSHDADQNLEKEGIAKERIHLVGNVMIDTLVALLPDAEIRWQSSNWQTWHDVQYVLATLHRPANVDTAASLHRIMDVFNRIAKDLPVLFPIHPRTLSQLDSVTICPGQYTGASQVYFVEPVGYLDCIALQQHAVAVITDSGGMQEETTYLGVPCFTLRSNTERPITLEVGTNELIGDLVELLPDKISAITKGFRKSCSIPPLWDGNAATRIAHVMTRNVC